MKRDELPLEQLLSADTAPHATHAGHAAHGGPAVPRLAGWPDGARTLWWAAGSHWSRRSSAERLAELPSLRAQLRPADLRSDRVAGALGYLAAVARDEGFTPGDHHGLAAYVMLHGGFAEMPDDMGGTIALALAASVAALAGLRVHLLSPSDQEALADAQRCRPLFERLGLRSAAVCRDASLSQRFDDYRADVVHVGAATLLQDAAAEAPPATGRGRQQAQALLPALEQALLHAADRLLLDEHVLPGSCPVRQAGDAVQPAGQASLRALIAGYARVGGVGCDLHDARDELRRRLGATVVRMATVAGPVAPIRVHVFLDAEARDAAVARLSASWRQEGRAAWIVDTAPADIGPGLAARLAGTGVILTRCSRSRRLDRRWIAALSTGTAGDQGRGPVLAMLTLDDPVLAALVPLRLRTLLGSALGRLADARRCLPPAVGGALVIWAQRLAERRDARRREAAPSAGADPSGHRR